MPPSQSVQVVVGVALHENLGTGTVPIATISFLPRVQLVAAVVLPNRNLTKVVPCYPRAVLSVEIWARVLVRVVEVGQLRPTMGRQVGQPPLLLLHSKAGVGARHKDWVALVGLGELVEASAEKMETGIAHAGS